MLVERMNKSKEKIEKLQCRYTSSKNSVLLGQLEIEPSNLLVNTMRSLDWSRMSSEVTIFSKRKRCGQKLFTNPTLSVLVEGQKMYSYATVPYLEALRKDS